MTTTWQKLSKESIDIENQKEGTPKFKKSTTMVIAI